MRTVPSYVRDFKFKLQQLRAHLPPLQVCLGESEHMPESRARTSFAAA